MHITNSKELELAIASLKEQCLENEIELRRDSKALVKKAEDAIASTSISLGSGVLAKKLMPFKKDGILGDLVSYGLQGAVTAAAFKNAPKIKAIGLAVLKNIFKRRE